MVLNDDSLETMKTVLEQDFSCKVINIKTIFAIRLRLIHDPKDNIKQIKIAFDGDAVIFSDESERIYQAEGLQAFAEHERKNAQSPLPEGPFAKLLKTISFKKNFLKNQSLFELRWSLPGMHLLMNV